MFSETDLVNPFLPSRRFVLAAVSDDCVLVALEQGGFAHMFLVLTLERSGSAWATTHQQVVPGRPRSLEELIAYAAK